jgi:hypothetical protein
MNAAQQLVRKRLAETEAKKSWFFIDYDRIT